MTQFRRIQTAFTTGELSETLRGRKDTALYYLGCEEATNVIVRPQGSARQRPGSVIQRLVALPAAEVERVRLAEFAFSDAQAYVAEVLDTGFVNVVDVATLAVDTVTHPFFGGDLDDVRWIQLLDVMLMVSPASHAIWEIARTPGGFVAGQYPLEAYPQFRYHGDRATTLAASGTSGSVTLTAAGGANNAVFDEDDVGSTWTMAGTQITIAAVASATSATATVVGTLPSAAATTNWAEAAASLRRGGFRSIAYFGDRLYLGGTRDAPFHIWASRVGAPFDFLAGGVEDDDPFSFSLSTGRADPIRHLVAGSGGLEVFTDASEGFIPGGIDSPITVRTVSYVEQTKYGSRKVPPVALDSQTMFAQRQGGAIREFVYSDVEQAYASVPLTVRAAHLLPDPVSMTTVAGGFGLPVDFLLVVNGNGKGAAMTSLRSEEVTAWTGWQRSARLLHDVQSVAGRVYLVIADGAGTFWLERLDETAIFDSQLSDTSVTAKTQWGPYTHLIGEDVEVFADGYWLGGLTVDGGGMIELDQPATAIDVGFPIEVRLRPMPPDAEDASLLGLPIRPYRAELSYLGSAGLRVNGKALADRPFDQVTDIQPQDTTNVRRVYLRGWHKGRTQAPLVTREGPFPFEIAAMAVDYRIGAG